MELRWPTNVLVQPQGPSLDPRRGPNTLRTGDGHDVHGMRLIDTCLLSRHVSTLNLVLFLCSPITRVARCLPLCCSSVATTVDRLCALSSSACECRGSVDSYPSYQGWPLCLAYSDIERTLCEVILGLDVARTALKAAVCSLECVHSATSRLWRATGLYMPP